MSGEDRVGVLTVCAANICRSPLAEYLLSRSLPDAARLDGVSWTSAGREASPNSPICISVVRNETQTEDWLTFAAQHRSRQLTASDIDGAALILTASQAERSAAGLLRPVARPWTFTILEAASLAEHAADTLEPGSLGGQGPEVLRQFAEVMNVSRGMVAIRPQARRTLFRRGRAGSPLDIPDAHQTSVPHHHVRETVHTAVARISTSLARLSGAEREDWPTWLAGGSMP